MSALGVGAVGRWCSGHEMLSGSSCPQANLGDQRATAFMVVS